MLPVNRHSVAINSAFDLTRERGSTNSCPLQKMEVPIVFIHIGGAPPPYARIAVEQARRWNPNAPIVFLSSVIQDYGAGETWTPIESIPMSAAHQRFREATPMKTFWKWTTERLFVLEDWMRSSSIGECIHFEYDNMIYQDLSKLVPLLRDISPGLSTTFHGHKGGNAVRACFSIVYCKALDTLANFTHFLACTAVNTDEMQLGGMYWEDTPEECSFLATAPIGVTLESERYRNWVEDSRFSELGVVFDGSAYGQYLGGVDPKYHAENTEPGYVNPHCDFRADQFEYVWLTEDGRRYPTIADKNGRPWKIMNLHIHCKRLHNFV